KELEQITYRALQNSFSQVMAQILQEIDEAIASGRDKNRFYLKDKRPLKFESVFGQVELKRNYYQDRKKGKYVYLLDQYLAFNGEIIGLSCHQSRGNSSTAFEHRGCPRGVCSSPSRCCFCRSRWALYEKSGDRQKR